MPRITRIALVGILLWMSSAAGWAEQVSRQQIKGLDEQIQDIKSDVLSIASELSRLEEKLLYPSDTQVSLFVSLEQGEKFRLDSVTIQLDGRDVTHHIYNFKELEALRKGGVQRIYTGNIRTGEHNLVVSLAGKSEGGSDYQQSATYKIDKGVGPKLVQIKVVAPGSGQPSIRFQDW